MNGCHGLQTRRRGIVQEEAEEISVCLQWEEMCAVSAPLRPPPRSDSKQIQGDVMTSLRPAAALCCSTDQDKDTQEELYR